MIYQEYIQRDIHTQMTAINSNDNKKTGRAFPCLNAEYTDPDFREHIMKTVYVRASMRDSRSIKSRSMNPCNQRVRWDAAENSDESIL